MTVCVCSVVSSIWRRDTHIDGSMHDLPHALYTTMQNPTSAHTHTYSHTHTCNPRTADAHTRTQARADLVHAHANAQKPPHTCRGACSRYTRESRCVPDW